ncbi:MAG: hypothetical protein GY798_13665 [Hyphomicrobiales bacterium]|nr:hypothetical protein [Hyphomicrobiales bacterium]
MIEARLRSTWLAAALLALIALPAGVSKSFAGEGAFSNYFPGSYGDLLIAVAPDPGPLIADLNLFYSAEASRAVLQGRANVGIDTSSLYSLFQGLYVWDAPAINGRFAVGGFVPLGYVSLDAKVTAGAGKAKASADEFGLGDVGIIPASFYWNSGNFHVNLYEMIIAPTGEYSKGDAVNIGRNYWSFDSVLATTWFNPNSGTELSLVSGLMVNTENQATNYRTGTEIHFDFAANQFLSETFSLGLAGYAYKQIEGDSGSGAILGDFKGEAVGVGLGFGWIPASGGGNFSLTGKWLHDVHAKNRLKGDYGVLTAAITF